MGARADGGIQYESEGRCWERGQGVGFTMGARACCGLHYGSEGRGWDLAWERGQMVGWKPGVEPSEGEEEEMTAWRSVVLSMLFASTCSSIWPYKTVKARILDT